ncbi:MAG TPA: DUF2637 domain-containing protein [Streptosporangiaceae bacterium]|nr:DUF2637 domain-containing protein [Streptosporangiaceae bacterium]
MSRVSTRSEAFQGGAPAAGSRADACIRVAAGVTVAGLAGIAGAISYSHMQELAAAPGETGWQAHAFPLSVDGIEIVASLVLLADRRTRAPVGLAAVGRAGRRDDGEPGRERRGGRRRAGRTGDRGLARVRARGNRGSLGTLRRLTTRLRPDTAVTASPPAPAAKKAASWILTPPGKLAADNRAKLARITAR